MMYVSAVFGKCIHWRSAANVIKKVTCNVQVCVDLNERLHVSANLAGLAVERTWGLQSFEGTILTLCKRRLMVRALELKTAIKSSR